MNLLKSIAILFFDILDQFIHQKRILNNLKKNNIDIKLFFDVGSHRGLYTDLIIKNFNVKKAYMFEPQINIFKYIKKKYKKNKKIKIFNNAISNKEKMQNFFINKHDLTSSLTELNDKNIYLKIKSKLFGGDISKMILKTYKVKTIGLKNLIQKNKIKKIDLLKIDTEGHELEVLKGLENKIKIIQIILIEFHKDNIYIKYNSNNIHTYLLKNKFFLKKKIKFPFAEWEDRIYINEKIY
jgi:FkbM family methyltransferase